MQYHLLALYQVPSNHNTTYSRKVFKIKSETTVTKMVDEDKAAALERKRKRLDAWRKRQEEKAKAAESEKPKAKITLSIGAKKLPKKKRKKNNSLGFGGDNEEDAKEEKKSLDLFDVADMKAAPSVPDSDHSSPAKKKRRWGATAETSNASTGGNGNSNEKDDDLDKFMDDLKAGAMGKVVLQTKRGVLSVDVSGSMLRPSTRHVSSVPNAVVPTSGGVITPEELAKLTGTKEKNKSNSTEDGAYYTPSEWESSASEVSFFQFLRFPLHANCKSHTCLT